MFGTSFHISPCLVRVNLMCRLDESRPKVLESWRCVCCSWIPYLGREWLINCVQTRGIVKNEWTYKAYSYDSARLFRFKGPVLKFPLKIARKVHFSESCLEHCTQFALCWWHWHYPTSSIRSLDLCGAGPRQLYSGKEKAHRHESFWPVTVWWGMCDLQIPRNINLFAPVPDREDQWPGWPDRVLRAKVLCAFSAPYLPNQISPNRWCSC